MKEVDLNRKVAKWICALPNGNAYKRLGYLHNKGEPDVTGCVQGVRIEIEGKMPGKKATPIQEFKLREWKKAGAITGVYHSLEEAQTIVIEGLKKYGICQGITVSTGRK